MAIYQVNGYCFEHAGEINIECSTEADARAKAEDLKKTILNELKVPRDSSAIVEILKGVGNNSKRISRERVEHP